MIIKKIDIKKFRGFENVSFELGSQLTIIAGKNGTQKTTILGMLSQPFTISSNENPMKDEKPLSGGSYKSSFKEKFKLSVNFDKAKSHEWSLHLYSDEKPFVTESISRGKDVRFWQKGNKGKGSGYIQLPVIFLSLKRLMPIGEDNRLKINSHTNLSPDEEKFYEEWHEKILLSQDKLSGTNYLTSPNKHTVGVNTDLYDWKQNSAGQDNVGKILLAILSFKRLKEKFKDVYKGGILAIDELDATLYPGSQIQLLIALRKFASNFDIQIFFTTHSMSILKNAYGLYDEFSKIKKSADHIKIIILEKLNNKIKVDQTADYNSIKNRLNEEMEFKKTIKIDVFREDDEAALFLKAILKNKKAKVNQIKCKFGCDQLVQLNSQKVPSFVFPNSIIILDGDVRKKTNFQQKIDKLKNIVVLPTDMSPEQMIASYLKKLDDESPLWKSINKDFTKNVCFKGYTLNEILKLREKAKEWFNNHNSYMNKIFKYWIDNNQEEVSQFIEEFFKVYNEIANIKGMELIKQNKKNVIHKNLSGNLENKIKC